ncbi:hypothetical protein WJX79_009132 [Trebouxia sp. C0005]
MGGCLSLNRSSEPGVPGGQDENRNHLDTLNFSGSHSQDISDLHSGSSLVKDSDSTDNGEASASTSARSANFPSTSASNYSNASAVTPTSVLPAMGSRDNHLWNHSYYVKVRKLREGSSGSVHLAVDLRYGNQVAIKFIPRGSNSIHVVAREVLNQRLCFHHPHIIQFREVFLSTDHLAIVSEFAAGGDLADYIDRHQAIYKKASMTESNALWLFHQLVTGVNFCHQMGIANRDIKLENTLLMDLSERPLVKLCDFGYSKDEYQGSACKTLCGTPEYVAPEVLARESYNGKAADVWSCGVVLYTLLTGTFPFRDPEEQRLSQGINNVCRAHISVRISVAQTPGLVQSRLDEGLQKRCVVAFSMAHKHHMSKMCQCGSVGPVNFEF